MASVSHEPQGPASHAHFSLKLQPQPGHGSTTHPRGPWQGARCEQGRTMAQPSSLSAPGVSWSLVSLTSQVSEGELTSLHHRFL